MNVRSAHAHSVSFTEFNFSGASVTQGLGVNNAGQIVGRGDNVGFLLDSGVFTEIAPPGLPFSRASGINDSGVIVGGANDGSGNSRGFVFNGTDYTILLDPSAPRSNAFGVNNLGLVVGRNSGLNGVPLGSWLFDGSTYSEISVDGATSTFATRINDTNQILGHYVDADGKTHGFLLDSGAVTSIDFPGAIGTAALGFNNQGAIVGAYFDKFLSHGFIINEDGIFTIDFPDARFTNIIDINDSGEMVGHYQDAAGNNHGIVATMVPTVFHSGHAPLIPEPSAAVLFGSGLLIVGFAVRRAGSTASNK